MNWYRRKTWDEFLEKFHTRKDKLRREAEQKASKLGHVLNAWTTMNNCVCRRCGAYAKINGVFAADDGVPFYGAAFTNPCSVRFDGDEDYEWEAFSNPDPKKALI